MGKKGIVGYLDEPVATITQRFATVYVYQQVFVSMVTSSFTEWLLMGTEMNERVKVMSCAVYSNNMDGLIEE